MKHVLIQTLALFLLLVPRAGAQDYLLRYLFPKGTEQTYKKVETISAHIAGPGGMEENIDRTTEARIRITAMDAPSGLVAYQFVQDTLYIDEKQSEQLGFRLSDLFQALNNKRIHVILTPRGDPKGISTIDSIRITLSIPVSLSDSVLRQQAVIFPPLPEKRVKAGESWTDERSDTVAPRFAVQNLGTNDGTTIRTFRTTYTIAGLEQKGKYSCLKINWKSETRNESKMIFGDTELYTEDTGNLTGTMYFAPSEGVLVEMKQISFNESATAMISGQDNTVMPSSTNTETTLTLIQ